MVNIFKNPNLAKYNPQRLGGPDEIMMRFINKQEQLTMLLNNISETYDVSDKETKKTIMLEMINSLASPGEEFDYEGWVADIGLNKGSMEELKAHQEKKQEQHAEWKLDDCHRFNLKRDIISVFV